MTLGLAVIDKGIFDIDLFSSLYIISMAGNENLVEIIVQIFRMKRYYLLTGTYNKGSKDEFFL